MNKRSPSKRLRFESEVQGDLTEVITSSQVRTVDKLNISFCIHLT